MGENINAEFPQSHSTICIENLKIAVASDSVGFTSRPKEKMKHEPKLYTSGRPLSQNADARSISEVSVE